MESIELVGNATLHAEWYSGGIVASLTARERFRLRVISLLEQRGLTQKALKGERSEGWISNIIAGRRNLKLDDAQQIADALQTPLAELLTRPDDQLYELDNLESLLIESFRQLAPDEQKALLTITTLRHRQAPYASGRPIATPRAAAYVPSRGAAHGGASSAHRTGTADDEIQHVIERAVKDIRAVESRQQAPITGAVSAPRPRDHRKVRGSALKAD